MGLTELDYENIGLRIRQFRKSRNFSQEELAEKIGISTTHMSHIENGSTKLSLSVLVDLAVNLDVKTDELLFEFENKDYSTKFAEIFSGCDEYMQNIIIAMAEALKKAMNENKI